MSVINPSLIEVRDEGTPQGRVLSLNFTGAGVTATAAGLVSTINIPGGGGGSLTITEVEVDFGTTPIRDATFNIIDATVNAASKVVISESGKIATNRIGSGDSLWDSIISTVLPAAGSFTLFCRVSPGPVVGRRILQYFVG